ncbi:hypothetical protein M0R45_003750 [Rubus argutus]|uniref:RED-like N-terminal domain-containing protein n=1 Tax=Rubus argutus TaxID=59490 RepID=A0AAW1YH40_RUBAR
MKSSKKHHKEKVIRRKEEKAEQPELPKYRDRAKERRDDQNPDYEANELGSFHAVAPPGNVDLGAADVHKLSIEKSKYLGGDLEHTHLVKGLDYALLTKVRSEIDKKPDVGDEVDAKSRASKEDQKVSFRTATAKSVYQWIVKPQTIIKTNEMFLPGRLSFIFNMEGGYTHDIPTTLHRSKADCPQPEEMATVSFDGAVLEKLLQVCHIFVLDLQGRLSRRKRRGKMQKVYGVDYAIPGKDLSQSPLSEDMEESPQEQGKSFLFDEPAYGPVQPYGLPHEWQETNGYRCDHAATTNGRVPTREKWQEYQYVSKWLILNSTSSQIWRGLCYKRDDQRLQQLREKDAREKGSQLYLRRVILNVTLAIKSIIVEVVDSDDEDDLSKMDMGGRAKGRLHRWDFETEEEWATYNEQKEAMPKAAFQFGVKMQDDVQAGKKLRV